VNEEVIIAILEQLISVFLWNILYFLVQWAAVRIHCGWMSEPPHMFELSMKMNDCHGHCPRSALLPPMI
jgi:hypothetical protein